jgi:quinol-cytochrome oxidoreductase complex cytochrome b subunit
LSSFNQLWEFLFDVLRRLGIVGTRGKVNLKEMDAEACSGTLLELIEIFSVIGVVLILATLFPPEIGQKADPFVTPSEVKPEWYFLFIYQGLKYVPKAVGVVLFLLVIPLLVTLLPLLDRHPGSAIQPGQRPLAAIAVLLVILGLSGLTILGWLA